MMAPYDGVTHASGKIHNFYLKRLCAEKEVDVTVVTLCKEDEINKLDFEKYGIKNYVSVRKRKGIQGYIWRGIAWLSKLNIWNEYAGLTPCDISKGIMKKVNELSASNYNPDIVILDWTEVLFLFPRIESLFPKAKIVAIEEDVSFLGQQRKAEFSKNILKKKFFETKYQRVKKLEMKYLDQCQLVILNNRKDYKLLLDNGYKNKNLWIWAPFFQSYLTKEANCGSHNIVFYGAMFREENWRSAVWFIENVMPKLKREDIRFVVIGGAPNKRLFKYNDKRIEIRGFVDDISKELSTAMCLVAPLVLGAGIKIKVLEAFSCGIPVLTNGIGIEGIPAQDKVDYFYCEKPDDYVEVINGLLDGEYDIKTIEKNAKAVIKNNFNFNKDAEEFVTKVLEI